MYLKSVNLPAMLMLFCLEPASIPAASAASGPNDLVISGAWVRTLTGALPAAGYFTLSNDSSRTENLIGADSPACRTLTLHQTIRAHSMSRMSAMDPQDSHAAMPGMTMMQPISSVPVPAHAAIHFSPGGLHLMCEQPGGAATPGQRIAVTLHFEDGRTATANFAVKGPRSR